MVKPGHKDMSLKADALMRAAGVERLILITDESRLPDPAAICRRLPEASIVICRDYEHADRKALARALRAVTAERRQLLLIAGDAHLAKLVGADGVHLPEHMLMRAGVRPALPYVSAACHTKPALVKAAKLGLDVALVSPVFPTESHAGTPALGTLRFAGLINRAGLPIAALGGITRQNAQALKGLKLHAIAGIGCFADL